MQEKAQEIHQHTMMAQEAFKWGQEHALAAIEVAESIVGTFNAAKRHVVVVPNDEERPSKRLREN